MSTELHPILVVTHDAGRPARRSRALRQAGFEVWDAENPVQFQTLIREHHPDAVLLDSRLPGLSPRVCRMLAGGSRRPAVVLTSAAAGPELAAEGGATFVEDTVSDPELVGRLRDTLSESRLRCEDQRTLRAELTGSVRQMRENMRNLLNSAAELRQMVLFGGPFPLPGRLVMVVDDEPVVMQVFRMGLERNGFVILEAEDGARGLEWLWRYGPAIEAVVLDWALPDRTGPQMVEEIRELSPETKVVVCSGSPRQGIYQELGGAAVSEVLEKPLIPATLVRTVRSVLQAPLTRHA